MRNTMKLVKAMRNMAIIFAVITGFTFAACDGGGSSVVQPVGIEMVNIPAGSFLMGSPDSDTSSHIGERPQRTVTMSAFKMSKYEVTQAQWAEVMTGNKNGISTNPSWFTSLADAGEVQENRPVEGVSWYDALVFCNRLSMAEGLSPAYSISGSTNPDDWGRAPASSNSTWNAVTIVLGSAGYRLPTEAQWEYACRAGTTTAYSYGSSANRDYMWDSSNSGSKTREVGKKLPNAWGLYDMHGNVLEWVWDWHGSYPSSAETDPSGASLGSYRVIRGGTCLSEAWRSATRSSFYPYIRNKGSLWLSDLGFRIVRPGDDPTPPGQVASFTATPGNAQVTLEWTVPIGGSVITGYEVTMDDWENKVTKTASELTHVYTGLTIGTEYVFRVRALNAIGAGAERTAAATTNIVEMVRISAGTFTRGSNNSQDWGASPAHTVTLTQGFQMGKYEVTQALWATVMTGNVNGISANPSWFHGGSGREPAAGEVQENRPVESVSWYDILVFCNRLSIMGGLTPAYQINNSANPDDWGAVPTEALTGSRGTWNAVTIVPGSTGYRLPTEAQWEYAARAGTTTAWSYGDTANGDYMWYSENSNSMTREVGKKLPNAWGLHDMHGNVREWCMDWYRSYAGYSSLRDPAGPVSGNHRVFRGGSWNGDAQSARSAIRNSNYYNDGSRDSNIGFRIVRP